MKSTIMKVTVMVVLDILLVFGMVFWYLGTHGFINVEANVKTHKTETYVDGELINTAYSNELLGCGMDINYNQSIYIGR